jgi:hypothetical protein
MAEATRTSNGSPDERRGTVVLCVADEIVNSRCLFGSSRFGPSKAASVALIDVTLR